MSYRRISSQRRGDRLLRGVALALALLLVTPPQAMALSQTMEGSSAGIASTETQPISNLKVGDRVVDPSWEWDYPTGGYYGQEYWTDPVSSGIVEPIVWRVVAKNHYAGLEPHVTLLSDSLVALGPFDNSSYRDHFSRPSNHWGRSGLPDAWLGLRPFVNGPFYDAFSPSFKNRVLTTTIANVDGPTGDSYTTQDRVFVLSTTELGYSAPELYSIGSALPYFDTEHADGPTGPPNDTLGQRRWAGSPVTGSTVQFTRTPMSGGDTSSQESVWVLSGTGSLLQSIASTARGPRPALNIRADVPVSVHSDANGHYVIDGLRPPAGRPLGQVTSWSGDARVSGKPARAADPVNSGDELSVGEEGHLSAEIPIGDGAAEIDLGPDTEVKIADQATEEDMLLEMLRGEVFARVRDMPAEHRFKVAHPQAVVAVRGTEWIIEADETTCTITVLDGEVEVSGTSESDSEIVGSGYAIQVTSEGRGVPYPIDVGDVDRWWEKAVAAPVSAVSADPLEPDGSDGWYLTSPAVSIEATDTGGGVAFVEWKLGPDTEWSREDTRSVSIPGLPDGEHTLYHRAGDLLGAVEETRAIEFAVDTTPPVTTSDAVATYTGSATITLDAEDVTSGVAGTFYRLGAGDAVAYGDPVVVGAPGEYTLAFWSVDIAGNTEAEQEVAFSVDPDPLPPIISGTDRYLTAIAGSKAAFESADAVVIATGENFADALGGAALAGALDAPLLLTQRGVLPSAVADEIVRLGASQAYILGGTGAVSADVESALDGLSGVANTTRIEGNDRYQTAAAIADKTIEVLEANGGYSGDAFIATGANFPDALGASPIAAAEGIPVLLADPARTSVSLPQSVERVWITGGTAVVSAQVETGLETSLGPANVDRLAGTDRFATAAAVAQFGVSRGMVWDGVGITTGMNFPDALAAGPVLGSRGAVMLLTDRNSVPTPTSDTLTANKAAIAKVTFFGGDAAVPPDVRATVNGLIEE